MQMEAAYRLFSNSYCQSLRTPGSLQTILIVVMAFTLLGLDVTGTQDDFEPYITLFTQDLTIYRHTKSNSSKNYYRYLKIDESQNYLFVGAMNTLIRLNLSNIQDENFKNVLLPPKPDKMQRCCLQGKKETPDCQNHIRVIFRSKNDTLFVCGTGADHPTAYYLHITNLTNKDKKEEEMSCPIDPFDNSTAVLVQKGNPDNIAALYSGTVSDFSQYTTMIYRPKLFYPNGTEAYGSLRTPRYATKWLNEPQFVASFELKDLVLFFFREIALEYTNCGKKIYSRVARVCKNDRGGWRILKSEWTTYLKARLNCSIPGQYPYYFDEIQDVYIVEEKRIFYGLFTTNINGLTASAICAYRFEDIESVFQGPFKDQTTDDSNWLAVPSFEVPKIRPGNCSIKDSRELPDNVLAFIKDKPLMDRAVPHQHGQPIFYKPNSMMQKLTVAYNVSGNGETVFFTASNQGKVFKIFQKPNYRKTPQAVLSAVYSPFKKSEPIWSMKLHEEYLYLGTDRQVVQMSVITCNKYMKVDICISDPYCGWHKKNGQCMKLCPNLITYKDINSLLPLDEAIFAVIKEQLYEERNVNLTTGSSFSLKVNYKLQIHGPVYWKKNAEAVLLGEHYLLSYDHSLILQNINESHEGAYTAKDRFNNVVAKYNITVFKDKSEVEKVWISKFQEWCVAFEDYKQQKERWNQQCNSASNVGSNDIPNNIQPSLTNN